MLKRLLGKSVDAKSLNFGGAERGIGKLKYRPAVPISGSQMPKFMTIGYGDQAGYDKPQSTYGTPPMPMTMLKRRGAMLGIAGPPVQVRNPDASGTETQ